MTERAIAAAVLQGLLVETRARPPAIVQRAVAVARNPGDVRAAELARERVRLALLVEELTRREATLGEQRAPRFRVVAPCALALGE